jgi:hypothetical protein
MVRTIALGKTHISFIFQDMSKPYIFPPFESFLLLRKMPAVDSRRVNKSKWEIVKKVVFLKFHKTFIQKQVRNYTYW